MSDEEIEQRIQRMRDGGAQDTGSAFGRGRGQAPGGQIPPQMAERIRTASPEELEQIKERMRQFGMSDDRIEEIVNQVRESSGGGS